MINSAKVTFDQLNSAVLEVQDELYQLGLWNEDSRLPQTEVFWCRFPQVVALRALGFFIPPRAKSLELIGYEVGNIYIPQWVLRRRFWKKRGSLRDVVRHEYGHAVEYHYPMLATRSKRFKSAFCGPYPGNYEENEHIYVTENAATEQTEDFADTFEIFVRHGGEIPSKLNTPHIKRKWNFIAELCEVIDSGATKW
jgi:hypothetical protein